MQTDQRAKETLTLQHLRTHSLTNLGPLHQRTFHSFVYHAQDHYCHEPLMLVEVPFRDELAMKFGLEGVVVPLNYRSWSNLICMNKAVFRQSPSVHIVNAKIRESFDISQCNLSCIRFC